MRLDHLLSKEKKQVRKLVILFSYQEIGNKLPVAMRLGETPVPIPNTMVKTQEADGTMLETAWESRWPPNQKEKNTGPVICDKKRTGRKLLIIYD